MTLQGLPLGYGLVKTFENINLAFGRHWQQCFTPFSNILQTQKITDDSRKQSTDWSTVKKIVSCSPTRMKCFGFKESLFSGHGPVFVVNTPASCSPLDGTWNRSGRSCLCSQCSVIVPRCCGPINHLVAAGDILCVLACAHFVRDCCQYRALLFRLQMADCDNLLTNPDVLKKLMSENKTIVAPMLESRAAYSNFWCGMTSQVVLHLSD